MPALRVLALAGPDRHGDAAVALAAVLAHAQAVALTVVALAPPARGPRCGQAEVRVVGAAPQPASA